MQSIALSMPMEQSLLVSDRSLTDEEVFPKTESRTAWEWFLKCLLISVAMALFICPDPLTDKLAFWILGKASLSIDFTMLVGKVRNIFFG